MRWESSQLARRTPVVDHTLSNAVKGRIDLRVVKLSLRKGHFQIERKRRDESLFLKVQKSQYPLQDFDKDSCFEDDEGRKKENNLSVVNFRFSFFSALRVNHVCEEIQLGILFANNQHPSIETKARSARKDCES